MKPINNFRDHPALKYDESKTIIVINSKYSSPEMYLVTDKDVVGITPIEVQHTNIGEPYRDLARFIFRIDREKEDDSIDIDPNDLQDLINMFKGLEWTSDIDITERLSRYLDSYCEE
jgi:hypothetical protein